MLIDGQKNFLSELTEKLSADWSKVGAVIGWAAKNQPVCLANFTSNPAIEIACQKSLSENTRTCFDLDSGAGIVIPVFTRNRNVGCIVCLLPESLSKQSEGLFAIFGQQMRQFQQHIQDSNDLLALSQQLSASYEELSLIYRVGQHLQRSEDPQTFLLQFADDLLELIDADKLMLFIRQNNKNQFIWRGRGSLPISEDHGQEICRYLLSQARPVHEPIMISTTSSEPDLEKLFGADYGILAWPICSNGNLLGILVAINTHPDGFDSTMSQLMGSVAEHMGSFMQNRFLLTDIQELITGLLTSFVNAIDAKDPYTRGHSQRVAYIAQKLAESLDLDKRESAEIYMAGLLHDIGKIGISDSVLSKPGKLTRDEFILVQQHPVIGSRIISSVKQLRRILPGVLHHHERYDGKGYPEGLQGEQIPLMGMIVGLADCFDAITSDRTYHQAMELEQAMAEIRNESGKQFSPTLVKALLRCDLNKLTVNLKILTSHPADMQIPAGLDWFDLCR
jgi:HD-GYP domain-containing protein (c-di-GMP phosphodiesterase class II)